MTRQEILKRITVIHSFVATTCHFLDKPATVGRQRYSMDESILPGYATMLHSKGIYRDYNSACRGGMARYSSEVARLKVNDRWFNLQ